VPGSREAAIELGQFLRSRRERISPADAGMIFAGRRRTPGLRREEVAILAGLSTTWYTYLEQGRGREVSPAVIDSIARVLRLTEDERRYIHSLAYGNAQGSPPAGTAGHDLDTTEALRQIVGTLDTYPYPVYMVDHVINLVAWNEAASVWYEDWDNLPGGQPNFLDWLLTSQRARESCVDWEDVALEIIARWRLQLAKMPAQKDATEFISNLRARSPQFATWWDEHDVLEHRVSHRRLRHPNRGTQSMRLVYLKTSHLELPAIVYHLPAITLLQLPPGEGEITKSANIGG
jgi:transcriptional regulator with XRE-family HTH domain